MADVVETTIPNIVYQINLSVLIVEETTLPDSEAVLNMKKQIKYRQYKEEIIYLGQKQLENIKGIGIECSLRNDMLGIVGTCPLVR